MRGRVIWNEAWLRDAGGIGVAVLHRGAEFTLLDRVDGPSTSLKDEYLYVSVDVPVRPGGPTEGFIFRHFVRLESPLEAIARQL